MKFDIVEPEMCYFLEMAIIPTWKFQSGSRKEPIVRKNYKGRRRKWYIVVKFEVALFQRPELWFAHYKLSTWKAYFTVSGSRYLLNDSS